MEDPTLAHEMTTAQLRTIRDTYPPMLTYSAVVALGVDIFGMTEHLMRKQLEHRPSAIPAVVQPGRGAARQTPTWTPRRRGTPEPD